MDPTYTDICETTLITRYVLPAIQHLFDRDIRLEFTFTEPADNYNREVGFTGRPDCIITIFPHQTDNGVNVGFGEVKKNPIAGDHHLVNLDLVRLATLGKNTINERVLLFAPSKFTICTILELIFAVLKLINHHTNRDKMHIGHP
ncbi:hypothetical protein [Parasitella parasitica]|uniref:Uncharacterized protein n=1 Tax=Parasitella parasitica TaxID=35722 RepID=A0A0B7MZD7_9FUNG|nr:hypothetical protein [Parasitella parasitica]